MSSGLTLLHVNPRVTDTADSCGESLVYNVNCCNYNYYTKRNLSISTITVGIE